MVCLFILSLFLLVPGLKVTGSAGDNPSINLAGSVCLNYRNKLILVIHFSDYFFLVMLNFCTILRIITLL